MTVFRQQRVRSVYARWHAVSRNVEAFHHVVFATVRYPLCYWNVEKFVFDGLENAFFLYLTLLWSNLTANFTLFVIDTQEYHLVSNFECVRIKKESNLSQEWIETQHAKPSDQFAPNNTFSNGLRKLLPPTLPQVSQAATLCVMDSMDPEVGTTTHFYILAHKTKATWIWLLFPLRAEKMDLQCKKFPARSQLLCFFESIYSLYLNKAAVLKLTKYIYNFN